MQRGSLVSISLLCVLIGSLVVAGNGGSDVVSDQFAQGTGEVEAPDMELTAVQAAALVAERRAKSRSTRGRRTVYGRRSQLPRDKGQRRKRDGFRGQGSRKQGRRR